MLYSLIASLSIFNDRCLNFCYRRSIITILIGPISMIASIMVIMIFIYLPETRKTPGDILLGMSLCDFIQTLNFIISSSLYLSHDTMDSKNILVFCNINGTVTTFVTTGVYLYNIAFVLSPLLLIKTSLTNKLSWVKYNQLINSPLMHIMIMLSTIVVLLTTQVYFSSVAYKSSGLCSSMGEYYVIIYGILIFAYFITAAMVVHQFQQLLSKNMDIQGSVREYLQIYRRFVMTTAFLWIIELVTCILTFQQRIVFGATSQTFFSMMLTMIPIIQCFVRVQDPVLKAQIVKLKLYQYLNRLFYPSDKQVKIETENNNFEPLLSGTELSIKSVPNIINKIQKSVRETQTYTMLAAIRMMSEPSCLNIIRLGTEEISDVTNETGTFSKQESDQKAELSMDNESVRTTFPGYHEFTVFSSKIILYSPEIFKYLRDTDKQMLNFNESLDLFKSKDSIMSCSSGPSGGKSGEFFFFSWDKKLIIKTMKWSEVLTLRKRVTLYGNYLFNHPDSMISKIYGIYTLKRLIGDSVDSNLHILVMRNISIGIPREYILRTFDMKGSEYDREVLNRNPAQDLSKITLKDLDFFKTERKIFIQPNLSSLLLNALKKDADFFKNCKLMDYSLLIMKIDWQSYLNATAPLGQFFCSLITNPLYMVESSKERGIFYHIAIIDYLQEWNVNKSAEQVTKKLIRFNSNLDTSAQNPEIYAERFKSKLLERIFTDDNESSAILDTYRVVR